MITLKPELLQETGKGMEAMAEVTEEDMVEVVTEEVTVTNIGVVVTK